MQLEEYLKNSKYFSLGHLPTEGFHPLTTGLSDLVQHHLGDAITLIQQIDLAAIEKIKSEIATIEKMRLAIATTLAKGHRIFLSGCGATGRLALTLESIFRKLHHGTPLENSVQALMAGGDFALVKSVENFEDFAEYGSRHLRDLGFKTGDLLIAISEGGETPYVLGTVTEALSRFDSQLNPEAACKPWFVYCNPHELLCKTVERSREVIENKNVESLCLPVGEMALSGSTRLQAATVQLFSVGLALLNHSSAAESPITLSQLDTFILNYSKLDLVSFLKPIIEWEADCYRQNSTVLYRTDSYPIAILTDTTERSPTFSLVPFEKSNSPQSMQASLSYLSIPGAHTSLDSWKAILNRTPIGLDWPEIQQKLDLDSILEFNFGREAIAERALRIQPRLQHEIRIDAHPILHQIEAKTAIFDLKINSCLLSNPLHEQVLIKVILNTLSLMVMGLMNRYEGNVMTWVRPSNGKLIDRTIRYLEFLIKKRNLKTCSHETLAKLIFETQASIAPDEAVILKVLEKIKS